MQDEPNIRVTLRLKRDRRQVTRGGYRRHTDQIPAAMWIRIADVLNRLQEAVATATIQRSRAVLLRERARELSAHLATTIAVPSAREPVSN
jgi:hypothetical protein